jgi:hypothetical protein
MNCVSNNKTFGFSIISSIGFPLIIQIHIDDLVIDIKKRK